MTDRDRQSGPDRDRQTTGRPTPPSSPRGDRASAIFVIAAVVFFVGLLGYAILFGVGGLATPLPSPSPLPSPTATASPSPTTTASPSPTATASPTPTASATASETPSTSPIPTPSS